MTSLRPAPDRPGLWPQLRHDERLSGHQPLAGGITDPVVAWRHYLGGPHFDGRLIPRGRASDLLLPYGGCLHLIDHGGRSLWKSEPHGFEAIVDVVDVDDDGELEILASNGKTLFVLAASSGRVLWSEYLGPPFAGGFMHTAVRVFRRAPGDRAMQVAVGLLSSKEVVVFDFASGAASPTRRHILWMDDFFHPTLLTADLDGDGRDELVVTKLSSVYAFDTTNGRLASECRWSSGGTPKRNYGMLAAESIYGSGAPDLVILSDRVSRHIAVVANDGRGALETRWDRFVEHIYESDECELRFVASSVLDVDGDGRPEIVVSIFNEAGDGRWWLEIIDAARGEILLRRADTYLRGIAGDIPGTAPNLLVSRETTRVPTGRGRVDALSWREGKLASVWSHDAAAFVGRFAETRSTRAFFRTDLPPSDDAWVVWLDGEALVPVLTAAGLSLLALGSDRPGLRAVDGTADVCAIIAVGDLDGDDRDELVVADERGGITFIQSDGTAIGSFRGGMRLRPGTAPYYMAKPMSAPVVSADAHGRFCAVPDGGSTVHVLSWDDETRRPRLLATPELRGRIGPEEAYHAVSWVAADERAALLGSVPGDGAATLRVVGPDGDRLHELTVPGIPASPVTPVARTGVYDYQLVDDAQGALVIVAGFRSPSMNSERLLALAVDGSVRWTLDGIVMPGHVLAGAPWNAASIERLSSGARLHFLAKDTLVALDVDSGAHVIPPRQLRPFNTADLRSRGLSMDDFSAYGSIVPVDVDGDGRSERVLVANYGGHGVVDDGGNALWWTGAPLSSLTGGYGALADIDGDGRLELGVSDASGDFLCIDAATGRERWRLHLGLVATGTASCDIDGDGRAEFIVATREGVLLAIATASNGSGLVLWRISFGSSLGPPTVADFDGDGRSEVLVVGGDGFLYAVDDRSRLRGEPAVS